MTRILRFLGYRPMVMLLDVTVTGVAFLLAFALQTHRFASPMESLYAYRELALLNAVAVIIAFQLLDLYSNWLRCSRAHLAYCVVVATVTSSVLTLAMGFLLGLLNVPRSVLLLGLALQLALVSTYRLLGSTAYRRWFGERKTIVVGETAESALRVAAEFSAEGGLYSVERCVVRSELTTCFSALNQAVTVVLAEDVCNKEDIILHCFRNNKEVLIAPNISELSSHGADVRGIQDLLLFAAQPHHLGPAESLVKRLFDLTGALFLLGLTFPLFIILSIVIPVTSKGPVFFRQERIGRYRRKFRIVKFRTMVHNAEESTGPVLATQRDPRITPLGRILRATRIDELPQLWNVLRGEMSLVGPRPEREFFVRQFEKLLPAYELRHSVKPGLTGLAQTKGRYRSSVERKLHFDLLYVYGYSLTLDMKILFQTIIVVLRGKQSVGKKQDHQSLWRPGTAVTPSSEFLTERVVESRKSPSNPF
jgi:exopolysaccharide biosynthesis polyprenyl glycosylphosphotransferase